MVRSWEVLKSKLPEYASIIDKGLHKLETYRLHTEVVSAYVLAMSMCLRFEGRLLINHLI
jgi:hypothetical protein